MVDRVTMCILCIIMIVCTAVFSRIAYNIAKLENVDKITKVVCITTSSVYNAICIALIFIGLVVVI